MGHTQFEKGQHIEPSPLLLQESYRRPSSNPHHPSSSEHTGTSACFRVTDLRISNPNGNGPGWERKGGAGLAAVPAGTRSSGGPRAAKPHPSMGVAVPSQPTCGADEVEMGTGDGARGTAGGLWG